MASCLYSLSTHWCLGLNSTMPCRNLRVLACYNNWGHVYRMCHGGAKKVGLKKEKEILRGYILSRYMEYVTNYKKLLEARFPSAMNMYRVFSVGLKDFYKDLKTYIPKRIKLPPTEKNLIKFSREDIELYYKMPSDMWKIAPVLILSAIPFGNYVIFPLALLKPRIWLTSHFWSVQQKADFSIHELHSRIRYNRLVFRSMVAELDSLQDSEKREGWRKVLGMLGSGVHPTPLNVIKFMDLFADRPYHLSKLGNLHVSYLLRMHGLHRGFFRRRRLFYRAFIIHQMDKAIIREGGADTLNTESLRNACLLRGLNSTHLTNQDMVEWLTQWLQVSREVTKESYSLLLYCPILFAHNHPQNWKLLYAS